MATPREKIQKNLPGWLVGLISEGFQSFANDAYREPTNATEAEVFRQLLGKGYTVLKRGWPDFMVITNEDDIFMVEVKASGDRLRPSQRVVLEAIARKGIDVYVWWSSGYHETIGKSRPITERMAEWKPREHEYGDDELFEMEQKWEFDPNER